MSDQAEVTEVEGTMSAESAATAALAKDKAQGDIFVKNGIKIEWTQDKDDEGVELGVYHVKMAGTARFDVVERPNEQGVIEFHSGLMKVAQDDLHDALATSCKNVANQAFRTIWNELFPPEVRERATRETLTVKNEKLSNENEQMRTAIEQAKIVRTEMFAAYKEGRPINIAMLREQGIDPEEYDLAEGD